MQRIIALILLIVISPFLLILYLVMKLTSKGPFVFKQKRTGKNLKIFTIYKIRTMVEEADKLKNEIRHLNEADGPVFKIRDDPRYTKVGKFIARIGLDEILQLINIVKGEMAFVGPRPLPVDEAQRVPEKYKKRFSVLPGLTSLWVIRGAHSLSFDDWMKSDLEYIQNKSFFLDFKILLTTMIFCLVCLIRGSY